jgi:hypothetical protein
VDKTLKKTGAFKDEVSRRGRKERATTPFFPFFVGWALFLERTFSKDTCREDKARFHYCSASFKELQVTWSCNEVGPDQVG